MDPRQAKVREPEYSERSVAFTGLLWGGGFFSPGGAGEVARILEGVDLVGRSVLDIGCGVGGVDVLLARDHGAAHVVGVDVEQMQVDLACRRAERECLSNRLTFECVAPGLLPFADCSFDVVFSKDAIIHVDDKAGLCTEAFRVLRPGGFFLASDWLKRIDGPLSTGLRDWVEKMGLTFHLETLESMGRKLRLAGFVDVVLRDRHAWYREVGRNELDRMRGPLYPELVAAIGAEPADDDIVCWEAMVRVLDDGDFGPGHFCGRKPLA